MGGEKTLAEAEAAVKEGSPPRGRGKGILAVVQHGIEGITPAWAGKRPHLSYSNSASWDHPRVGGEKAAILRAVCGPRGSPPRGRGKGCAMKVPPCQLGITPAWAGKSSVRACFVLWFQDHPRVGGEKARTLIVQNEPQGSPPRGRGKELLSWRTHMTPRITPAWAGKRYKPVRGISSKQDHPRVGGEKQESRQGQKPGVGSPPRGRGKD